MPTDPFVIRRKARHARRWNWNQLQRVLALDLLSIFSRLAGVLKSSMLICGGECYEKQSGHFDYTRPAGDSRKLAGKRAKSITVDHPAGAARLEPPGAGINSGSAGLEPAVICL
jgi:hypothetical protein